MDDGSEDMEEITEGTGDLKDKEEDKSSQDDSVIILDDSDEEEEESESEGSYSWL